MNQIIRLFIRRPVMAVAVSLFFLIAGLAVYPHMPVRQFPRIGDLFLSVTTLYPGAAPQVLEQYVSTPIMAAISGVSGIDYVAAENAHGKSVVTVKLIQGQDPDRVLTEVNTRVTAILWRLPHGVLSPMVKKNLTETPCVFFSFKSRAWAAERISDYLDRVIAPQLASLPGVRTMLFHGHRSLAMRVHLDPEKMAAHDITALEIKQALAGNNVRSTAGRFEGGLEELDLRLESELSRPEQFQDIILRNQNDTLLRLKDIGSASLGPRERRTAVFEGGANVVVLGVTPHDSADSVKVAQAVLGKVPQIKQQLPPELSLSTPWVPAHISADAVQTVFSSAWLAVVCVLVVIFLFLADLRAIAVPAVTIPLSVIGACFFAYLAGCSINTLTLLAAVLAIGLVVDDAIVVVENVHRHLNMGGRAMDAADAGACEIARPVIAMTLTVAAVFAPIGLLPGMTGALFHQFAFFIAVTVLLSGFFALILSPAMCVILLSPTRPQSIAGRVDRLWAAVGRAYERVLSGLLRHKILMAMVVAALFAGTWQLYVNTRSELMPDENQGVVLGIGIGPSAANLDYSIAHSRAIGDIYESVPERAGYAIINGWQGRVNRVTSFMVLRQPPLPGDRSEDQIIADLQPRFKKITGMRAFAINRPPMLDIMGVTSPVNFVLQTADSDEQLDAAMTGLLGRVRQHPGFVGAHANMAFDKPGVLATINRDLAHDLGISVKDIVDTLNMLLGEPIIGWFAHGGWGYPVVPRVLPPFHDAPHNLDLYQVRARNGKLIPLSAILTYRIKAESQTRNQFQQMKSATLTANLAKGFSLGQALAFLNHVADTELPETIQRNYSGASREFVRAGRRMMLIFIFCMAVIYLMLAAQFASFRDPLIIMLSVPLSVFGALLTMRWFDASLNIYTQIGLVMLIGLITKHGILIVNFANARMQAGQSARQAVREAARVRLRPVLMTTCAMVFGALPLLLATGGGHESLNQIGAVIIGGLSFGTLLTLFVVPVVYTFGR